METFTLIAKVSVCVALIAAVREGMRSKSEALMTIALLLLIPAVPVLIAEIRNPGYRNFSGLQFTPEEREIAEKQIVKEWSYHQRPFDLQDEMAVRCFFTEPPADATFPENVPSN